MQGFPKSFYNFGASLGSMLWTDGIGEKQERVRKDEEKMNALPLNEEKYKQAINEEYEVIVQCDNETCCVCNSFLPMPELISLSCSHFYCSICLINQLEINLEQKQPTLMLCNNCDTVIPCIKLAGTVEEDSFLEYVKNISASLSDKETKACCPNCHNLKSSSLINESIECICHFPLCLKCSENHSDRQSCINYYNLRHNKKIDKLCRLCSEPAFEGLTCNCTICRNCLLVHIRESVLNSPLDEVFCQFCKELVQKSAIYDIFSSKSAFISFQENSLLAPRFECPICIRSVLVEGSITLDCEHRYCEACFASYVNNLFSQAAVDIQKIPCPECPTEISYHEIKAAIGSCILEKNEIKLMRTLIPINPNEALKICYKCNYGEFIDKTAKWFTCTNCKLGYCPKCNKRHNGNCSMIETSLTPTDIQKILKLEKFEALKCPSCKGTVVKEGGCNFCKCPWPQCKEGVFFCALCKRVLNVRRS
jgi:hypothetical protein